MYLEMDEYAPFSSIGWLMIILGALFVALPYLSRVIPDLERIPWFILYVYKRDGFYFATSPILILLSLLSLFRNR